MSRMQKKHNQEETIVYLVLHNIRSAHNVGAMFRTADAAGVAKIFLTGYTPTPTDRFGRQRSDIAKTALGAEKSVPWGQAVHLASLFPQLKKQGVTLVALEQAPGATDYKKYVPHYPVALIVGNEVRGISPAMVRHCDAVIEISMRGRKESLNVAVAAGVALFRILDV